MRSNLGGSAGPFSAGNTKVGERWQGEEKRAEASHGKEAFLRLGWSVRKVPVFLGKGTQTSGTGESSRGRDRPGARSPASFYSAVGRAPRDTSKNSHVGALGEPAFEHTS